MGGSGPATSSFMRTHLAIERYLARHIEPELPQPPVGQPPWNQVLVIPIYNESAELLERLAQWQCPARTLVIAVLNRPDSANDVRGNDAMRSAAHLWPEGQGTDTPLLHLSERLDLYLHDLEQLRGPSPAREGVGLARKVGCDIAFYWQQLGKIHCDWICSSDAGCLAAHRLLSAPGATAGVLGRRSVSPSITMRRDHAGKHWRPVCTSCACITMSLGWNTPNRPTPITPWAVAWPYGARVTHRSGAFRDGPVERISTCLNKAAKTGEIHRLSGDCIELQSRVSDRVPFGTGPAVSKILHGDDVLSTAVFYHPLCYEALRAVLQAVPLYAAEAADDRIEEALLTTGLDLSVVTASTSVLETMGIARALAHCRKQSRSHAQFLRQFHQWFDGFRTLKFIHGIRDSGWPQQNLEALVALSPQLWPGSGTPCNEPVTLRQACEHHWGWTRASSDC